MPTDLKTPTAAKAAAAKAAAARSPVARLQAAAAPATFGLALLGLASGGALTLSGHPAGGWIWAAVTALVGAANLIAVLRDLTRGAVGADVIAMLAMGASLALGEFLAGAILAVMLSGGALLERFAAMRARRALTSLLERAPTTTRRREGAQWTTVPIESVAVGDQLLVNPGEVVPSDGVLASPSAVLDEAALTGEAEPTTYRQGDRVRSGGTNAGSPFEFRVTTPPSESTYAGILRLVEAAEESKAPFVRLADRYALAFLVATLLLAGASWLFGGTPERALAVLVVATPCPLLLAAPAAFLSGVSRAARAGVVIKGGAPLESLAQARLLLLDKTGTLTTGRPKVSSTESLGSLEADRWLRLAGSLEQASLHPFAPAVTEAAREGGFALEFPTQVEESLGSGIDGVVDGSRVRVGQLAHVAPGVSPGSVPALAALGRRAALDGSTAVFVSVEGELAGALVLEDPIRAEAPRALRTLRRMGIGPIHMVTGDHPDVAELVGDALGIDHVFAERTPAEKVAVVRQVRKGGVTVMIGDGLNDAPALALADVGIAMGARGASAASEAADVVLMSDRLEGLVDAIRIARRTRRIALQSVLVGMGLSVVAMGVAAAGYLTPVMGAVVQEVVDVLVIVNALRALGGSRSTARPRPEHRELSAELAASHRSLRPIVVDLSTLAEDLESMTPEAARAALEATCTALEQDLLPHERSEQERAYPILAELLGDEDPTGPLVGTHHEIERRVRLLRRMVAASSRQGPAADEVRDLRRVLYGLHAILTLHFAQEEELYALLGAPGH